jgi:hypothetical protein
MLTKKGLLHFVCIGVANEKLGTTESTVPPPLEKIYLRHHRLKILRLQLHRSFAQALKYFAVVIFKKFNGHGESL